MVGRVSVLNSRELQAIIFATKAAPKTVAAEVRKATRNAIGPQWGKAVASKAKTTQQTRVIVNTSKVRVSDQSVVLTSLSSRRRALSGGLVPVEDGKGFEFGSSKASQFPRARASGYVIYPAFADIVPRALALWVQTVLRVIHEALEGKGG